METVDWSFIALFWVGSGEFLFLYSQGNREYEK